MGHAWLHAYYGSALFIIKKQVLAGAIKLKGCGLQVVVLLQSRHPMQRQI